MARKYKSGRFLHKFYFIKATFLQTIFEGNLSYFVYACFNNLSVPFSFNYADRLALSLTITFFFVVILFSFTFYYLICEFLQMHASYFMFGVSWSRYDCYLITIKNLLRNFTRGAIFYFMQEMFTYELLLLGLVEIIVVSSALALQRVGRIFVSKLFFCSSLLCKRKQINLGSEIPGIKNSITNDDIARHHDHSDDDLGLDARQLAEG